MSAVGDGADVERYEQLRRRALGGEAAGWRLGLAVLQRQRRRRVDCEPGETITPRRRPLARQPACPPAPADELVGVLAAMALACLRTG